ncbi:hypothetical protein ACP70R_030671 [Stipagrostis hirtigluma subsp. patula]
MEKETQATQPPSDSSAAAAYPRWVLLSQQPLYQAVGDDSTAGAKTLAAGRTSAGHLIRVFLHLAPPPEESRVCFHAPEGGISYASVLAAHGDSVLIQTAYGYGSPEGIDHFVYNAGAAAAGTPRPPSLSLLPPYYSAGEQMGPYSSCPGAPLKHILNHDSAGLLRRGEDEFVVAELKMVASVATPTQVVTKLLLFRSGVWSIKRPLIRRSDGKDDGEEPPSWARADTVLPVGDRLLCWVDVSGGLMFCDVFDESPELRYVPLPMDAAEPQFGQRSSRNVSVTAGGAVKFVNVFPRCCCGGAGASDCRHSHRAYTINTWTLTVDDMAWVMDGMVDATELWALDAYEGLPRVQLDPFAIMEDPHTICFLVCEGYHVKHGDRALWVIMVDMRRKTIVSVFRCPEEQRCSPGPGNSPLQSRISDCLNSYPNCTNGALATSKSDMDMETSPMIAVDEQLMTKNNARNLALQTSYMSSARPIQESSKVASSEETILAALEEIPGLALEDMLKAYSILSHDNNGRRFRSLLGLPMNLRKAWLLMEIKASEACAICSACTADRQHV